MSIQSRKYSKFFFVVDHITKQDLVMSSATKNVKKKPQFGYYLLKTYHIRRLVSTAQAYTCLVWDLINWTVPSYLFIYKYMLHTTDTSYVKIDSVISAREQINTYTVKLITFYVFFFHSINWLN